MQTSLIGLARRVRRRLARLGQDKDAGRFMGRFASFPEAMRSIGPDRLAGYDNDDVAEIHFEPMCRLELWDYPVLFWLQRLIGEGSNLVDAGGHMGTKYRAFRNHLRIPDRFEWSIYDVPAVIRAGRRRASQDGLTGLTFHDRIEDTPPTQLLLASGLLQYLDVSLAELLARLPNKPRHLLLNKVATREGPTIVTLEQFPGAEVPYQVRDRAEFEEMLSRLGYAIRDRWTIPSFSRSHRAFGESTSRGYYAELT